MAVSSGQVSIDGSPVSIVNVGANVAVSLSFVTGTVVYLGDTTVMPSTGFWFYNTAQPLVLTFHSAGVLYGIAPVGVPPTRMSFLILP